MIFIHYNNYYIQLGHIAYAENFIDWEFVRGFAKCTIEGKNRYFENSCDILNRDVVYPPLWLHTPGIVYFIKPDFLFWLIYSTVLAVIIKFIKINNFKKIFLLLAIMSSPNFLYAFQRLNVDLIFLLLIFFLIIVYEQKNYFGKIFGDFLLLGISFLKIYPAILFLLTLKEKKIKIFIIFLIGCVFLTLTFLNYKDEIIIMFKNINMAGLPGSGTFSGSSFYYFTLKLIGISSSPHSIIFKILNLTFVILLFLLIKDNSKKLSIGDGFSLNEKFWVAGFLIITFCFVTGYNVNYRLIFIMLLLPLFFDQRFYSEKLNQHLIKIFFVIYFLRNHSITLIVNFLLIDPNFMLENLNNTYYDLYDAALQWIFIGNLIYIFKKNYFHRKLVPHF